MELKGLAEQRHLHSLLKADLSVSVCCTQYVLFFCYFKEKIVCIFFHREVSRCVNLARHSIP